MNATYDDIVIGAGILGLATATHLSARGRRVAILERSNRARGASVRNFGMVWPIGQPAGERLQVALESSAFWEATLREAGIWLEPVGSLHAAYYDDEAEVLHEFARDANDRGFDVQLLGADEAVERSPRLVQRDLRCALLSRTEACVDPRQAVAGIASWLQRARSVDIHFDTGVTAIDDGKVVAKDREFHAERVWLCSGDELAGLRGELLSSLGLVPCKLQMMRTGALPHGERIGPMLAAGLTLRHYLSFAHCPSLARLGKNLDARHPGYAEYGIHVMVSQNGSDELTIGDSHEYGTAIEPFDKPMIDTMILDYLARFFDLRGEPIVQRWHGIYAKHPTEPWVVRHPEPKLTVINGVGGNGMTLSFGLTGRVVREVLA